MICALDDVQLEFASRRGVVRPLDGVSFGVPQGARVALIGPSGAGKTSLFRILNGTLAASAGAVRFDGRDLSELRPRDLRLVRRRIGSIQQQPHLVPSLSALQNALTGRLGHWSLPRTIWSLVRPADADLALARAALRRVGLAGKEEARADELSGGQQQRLALARVLVQDPDLVLADEPFASLDPALTEEMAGLLFEVAARPGRTLVVTLHDVQLALRHFPRIIALRGGRVAFDLPASDVSADRLEDLYRLEAGAHGT